MKRMLCMLVAGAVMLPTSAMAENLKTEVVIPTIFQGYRNGQFTGFHHVSEGTGDRCVLEFDMDALTKTIVSVTLHLFYVNFDPGEPFGIMDLYDFEGNGVADIDDYWAGDVPFLAFEDDNDTHTTGGVALRSFDITDTFDLVTNEHWSYFGIRISTETSDRFVFGGWGGNRPHPVLTIDYRTFDSNDYILFQECLGGPDASIGDDCVTFDFDGDCDVDLADFAVFQSSFDGGVSPPPSEDCCDANHGPGCDDPEVMDVMCHWLPPCCEIDWDELCVFVAAFLPELPDCPE